LNCPRTAAKDISRLSLGRPALAAKFFQDREFYQSYLETSETFLNFFTANVNERITAIEKISGGREEENKVAKALSILNIWQGVLRDLLLLNGNNGDLIRNEPSRKKMDSLKNNLSGARLQVLSESLKRGERYIRGNVNPKLVLENIAVNV